MASDSPVSPPAATLTVRTSLAASLGCRCPEETRSSLSSAVPATTSPSTVVRPCPSATKWAVASSATFLTKAARFSSRSRWKRGADCPPRPCLFGRSTRSVCSTVFAVPANVAKTHVSPVSTTNPKALSSASSASTRPSTWKRRSQRYDWRVTGLSGSNATDTMRGFLPPSRPTYRARPFGGVCLYSFSLACAEDSAAWTDCRFTGFLMFDATPSSSVSLAAARQMGTRAGIRKLMHDVPSPATAASALSSRL
mmetsp:Transcript_28870/g.49314  ORF Transcript_28870/g.49314 Transcript_28870/m.49314 type:complete len:253 (+) Transcript_28870:326-1084(+)